MQRAIRVRGSSWSELYIYLLVRPTCWGHSRVLGRPYYPLSASPTLPWGHSRVLGRPYYPLSASPTLPWGHSRVLGRPALPVLPRVPEPRLCGAEPAGQHNEQGVAGQLWGHRGGAEGVGVAFRPSMVRHATCASMGASPSTVPRPFSSTAHASLCCVFQSQASTLCSTEGTGTCPGPISQRGRGGTVLQARDRRDGVD